MKFPPKISPYIFALVITGIFFVKDTSAAIPPLPGDISSDDQVNMDDLGIMAEQWLNTGPGWSADLTGNEAVNVEDLSQLSGGWLNFMVKDTFSSTSSMADWTVVDEGSISTPSNWAISGGYMWQTSNI